MLISYIFPMSMKHHAKILSRKILRLSLSEPAGNHDKSFYFIDAATQYNYLCLILVSRVKSLNPLSHVKVVLNFTLFWFLTVFVANNHKRHIL